MVNLYVHEASPCSLLPARIGLPAQQNRNPAAGRDNCAAAASCRRPGAILPPAVLCGSNAGCGDDQRLRWMQAITPRHHLLQASFFIYSARGVHIATHSTNALNAFCRCARICASLAPGASDGTADAASGLRLNRRRCGSLETGCF